jgi:polyferredoxin
LPPWQTRSWQFADGGAKKTSLEILSDTLQIIVATGLVLAGILVILIWKKDKTRRVSYLRFFIGTASVIAIFYLFTFSIWLLLVLGVIVVMTIVSGRFFCGWICPFGLYMDLIAVVRKLLKIDYWNLPERINRILNLLRYPILAAVLAIPFIGTPLSSIFWQPYILFFRGPYAPLNFLLGPLEPLIVPWAGAVGFNGWSLSYPYIRTIMDYTSGTGSTFVSLFVVVFIGLTAASSFVVRRFWCRFCPTGVSIGILNRFKPFKWAPLLHIDKDEEKCTKCGICKRVCPAQVTEVYEEKGGNVTPSMCMLCFRCVEMCPYEDTLKVKIAGKTAFRSRNWLEPAKSD